MREGLELVNPHRCPDWVSTICCLALALMVGAAFGYSVGVAETSEHYLSNYTLKVK